MPSLMDILNRVDDEKTISFPIALSGTCSAAKKNQLAKISMAVPREIVDRSLSELQNWQLIIVAIKREEFDKVIEQAQKPVWDDSDVPIVIPKWKPEEAGT